MYKLEYLYEQLKSQTVERIYINTLNAVLESCYDSTDVDSSILETMNMIEEAAKQVKINFFDKIKATLISNEKVLSKYKERALKCKPVGLTYKNYSETISEAEIKKRYNTALAYLNKFNPNTASEEQLKTYIMDSNNNVQYNHISRIFGDGKERFSITDVITKSQKDKEITKSDISEAVKLLEKTDLYSKKLDKESKDINNDYTAYVRNNGLATPKTNFGNINDLRKNALNHKMALISIADATYYQMLLIKIMNDSSQAKHIVVKAANYNPRNLKESAIIQDYIDTSYAMRER